MHDHALRSFPKAGVAYADVHSLLACVAAGDTPTLERLLGEIRQRIAAGRYPPGEVVIWIANGFAAYAAGDWNGAIRCLEQALPQTVRIGGSRAQRDLVSLTLAAAYIKADRPEEASALIDRGAPSAAWDRSRRITERRGKTVGFAKTVVRSSSGIMRGLVRRRVSAPNWLAGDSSRAFMSLTPSSVKLRLDNSLCAHRTGT